MAAKPSHRRGFSTPVDRRVSVTLNLNRTRFQRRRLRFRAKRSTMPCFRHSVALAEIIVTSRRCHFSILVDNRSAFMIRY